MPAFVAGLPAWLKYVVITLIPWIELRGAIPLAFQQGEQLYLPLILRGTGQGPDPWARGGQQR